MKYSYHLHFIFRKIYVPYIAFHVEIEFKFARIQNYIIKELVIGVPGGMIW